MKFSMMSVVVGTPACTTLCPFCVSGEKINKENKEMEDINIRNLNIALQLAENSGVNTIMLTGRGEPTLFPDKITEYLKEFKKYKIPFKELQTNAMTFGFNYNGYERYLKQWYNLGLTHITISTVSEKSEINKKIYMKDRKEYFDLEDTIKKLHDIGYTVRLTCVATKDWMSTSDDLFDYINFAKKNNVRQVTIRPLNDEYRRSSAQLWIEKHKLTESDKVNIYNILNDNGTKLMTLDNIGDIFDIDGQNVLFSFPLTMNTRNKDIENMRNLIFFPNGEIRYEWEKEGAVLL